MTRALLICVPLAGLLAAGCGPNCPDGTYPTDKGGCAELGGDGTGGGGGGGGGCSGAFLGQPMITSDRPTRPIADNIRVRLITLSPSVAELASA